MVDEERMAVDEEAVDEERKEVEEEEVVCSRDYRTDGPLSWLETGIFPTLHTLRIGNHFSSKQDFSVAGEL